MCLCVRVCVCVCVCVCVRVSRDRPHLLLSYRKIKWAWCPGLLTAPAVGKYLYSHIRTKDKEGRDEREERRGEERRGEERRGEESDLALIQVSHISAGAADSCRGRKKEVVVLWGGVWGFIHPLSQIVTRSS